MQDTLPEIVEAPLTRNFTVGQGVSLSFFDYTGGQYINKVQLCTKNNILKLTTGCLNVARNKKTRQEKPEIGTDGSIHTCLNPWIDSYGSGLPRDTGLGFWKGLGMHRTVFAV